MFVYLHFFYYLIIVVIFTPVYVGKLLLCLCSIIHHVDLSFTMHLYYTVIPFLKMES